MNAYLMVALGGAAGSVARYALAAFADGRLGVPWGTWVVNVLGCLVIGLVAGSDRPWVKPLIMVGVLGGFTTFSSFSLQTVTLLQNGEPLKAIAYVLASVVVCLLAVWLGLVLARG